MRRTVFLVHDKTCLECDCGGFLHCSPGMVAKASCGGREAPVCSSGQFCFNEACFVERLKGESIDPRVIRVK